MAALSSSSIPSGRTARLNSVSPRKCSRGARVSRPCATAGAIPASVCSRLPSPARATHRTRRNCCARNCPNSSAELIHEPRTSDPSFSNFILFGALDGPAAPRWGASLRARRPSFNSFRTGSGTADEWGQTNRKTSSLILSCSGIPINLDALARPATRKMKRCKNRSETVHFFVA